MGKSLKKSGNDIFVPASTPEERENQLTSMAYDLAADRIMNGTATAQEIVYFLKLGSPKTKLEMELLKKQNQLMQAKTESIQSAKRMEELYSKAMAMMSEYDGSADDDEFYDSDLQ